MSTIGLVLPESSPCIIRTKSWVYDIPYLVALDLDGGVGAVVVGALLALQGAGRTALALVPEIGRHNNNGVSLKNRML